MVTAIPLIEQPGARLLTFNNVDLKGVRCSVTGKKLLRRPKA
jgi:hypothetical protein